jgi:NADPH-dependent 2,4-dienoyl-CoA reductase/sulfur reductase-like enzyme
LLPLWGQRSGDSRKRGGPLSAAGPPQGANYSPFGGSAAATAASVGVHPTGIDVAVVGAGPAGLAAATLCAGYGLATTLLDEQPAPGGQIYRGVVDASPARLALLGDDYSHGASLVQAYRDSGATHRSNATVWGAFPRRATGIELGVSLRSGAAMTTELQPARAVIFATGAQERPFPIPGWTLPGVMTVGGAQILLKTAGLVPNGRVVLAGCGPLLWLVASQLLAAGVAIDAVLDTTPRGRLRSVLAHAPAFVASSYFAKGLALARRVRRQTRVVEYVTSLAAEGDGRIETIRFVADGVAQQMPVDALLLHQGVVPGINLSGAAGCALRWDASQACFASVVDAWGGTTVPLLFVAGDGASVEGARAAESRGRLTALAVVNALGRIDGRTRDSDAHVHRRALAHALRGRLFLDALYRPADPFRIPEGETIVCRCEEVTARQVVDAARRCAGPNQAKALLRCGMGPCQGRFCGLTVTELIARARGMSAADVGYFRLRFPAKPLPLGELAQLPSSPEALAAVVRARGTH